MPRCAARAASARVVGTATARGGAASRAASRPRACSRPGSRPWPRSRWRAASALKVWNFTASAPASAAASTRRSARSSEPLWLTPASAMTKVRSAMANLRRDGSVFFSSAARGGSVRASGDDAPARCAVAVWIDDAGCSRARSALRDRLADRSHARARNAAPTPPRGGRAGGRRCQPSATPNDGAS